MSNLTNSLHRGFDRLDQFLGRYFHHAETWNVAVLLFGGIALFLALTLEYMFIQEPCNLCLTQRYFMFFGTLIAMLGLIIDPRLGILPVLSIVSYLGGTVFAFRQLWLQANPHLAEDCGFGVTYLIENDWPLKQILRAFMEGSTDCAEPSMIPSLSLLALVILITMSVLQLLYGPRSKY